MSCGFIRFCSPLESKLIRRTSGTVKIVEIVNLPVQYVTNQATRIMVKAAGELSADAQASLDGENIFNDASLPDFSDDVEEEKHVSGQEDASEPIHQIEEYTPDIRKRQWYISEIDLGKISSYAAPSVVAIIMTIFF